MFYDLNHIYEVKRDLAMTSLKHGVNLSRRACRQHVSLLAIATLLAGAAANPVEVSVIYYFKIYCLLADPTDMLNFELKRVQFARFANFMFNFLNF